MSKTKYLNGLHLVLLLAFWVAGCSQNSTSGTLGQLPSSLIISIGGSSSVAYVGEDIGATWDVTDDQPTDIRIEISFDDGATWETLETNISNSGSYEYSAPDRIGSSFRMRLSDIDGLVFAESEDISIVAKSSGLIYAASEVVPEFGMAVVELGLEQILTEDLVIGWETLAGTATADVDFVASSGSVTIEAGELSGLISVPVLSDSENEVTESFRIQLTLPSKFEELTSDILVTIQDIQVAELSGAVTLMARNDSACIRTSEGELKCWGSNLYSQLGDTSQVSSAAAKPFGFEPSAEYRTFGVAHGCYLKSGTVKCWGVNRYGALGNGSEADSTSPVDVAGLAGVTQIVTGNYHNCAVIDGGLRCWGGNAYGQLGNGDIEDTNTPVDVTGLGDGVSMVSSNTFTTCAVVNGAAKCWGYNGDGQIGDGSTDNKTVPTDVVGLSSGVTEIHNGSQSTCAVVNAGVKCWGENGNGQLGDGTTTDRSTPVDVVGLTSGVEQIGLGLYHGCALLTGGQVKCWGENANGQLGDGTTTRRASPVDVTGLPSGVAQLALSRQFSCARIGATGQVLCWGENSLGQIGSSEIGMVYLPNHIEGLSSGVRKLVAGTGFNCVLMQAGNVKCWGNNADGNLGDGSNVPSHIPVDVVGLNDILDIEASEDHVCVITANGGVKCWGDNSDGQIGNNTTVDQNSPTDVIGLDAGVTGLGLTEDASCAILAGGTVKCWGEGGNTADGDNVDDLTPVDTVDFGAAVVAISNSVEDADHACALLQTGEVKCWGDGGDGQLGDGGTTDLPSPVLVQQLPDNVDHVATGQDHSCVLTASGQVYCWGANSDREYGFDQEEVQFPTLVEEFPERVKRLVVSEHTTAVVTEEGKVSLIGNDPFKASELREVFRVPGMQGGIDDIALGNNHLCALTELGGVLCVGRNTTYGEAGLEPTGGVSDILTPTVVVEETP